MYRSKDGGETWQKLTEANAHRLDPSDEHQYDIVGVEELAAGKPNVRLIWVE